MQYHHIGLSDNPGLTFPGQFPFPSPCTSWRSHQPLQPGSDSRVIFLAVRWSVISSIFSVPVFISNPTLLSVLPSNASAAACGAELSVVLMQFFSKIIKLKYLCRFFSVQLATKQ